MSPKGVHLSAPDPIGTIGDIAHNPLPLLGLIPGVGGLAGGLLSHIPGIGGALSGGLGAASGALSHIPGASSLGGVVSKLGGSGGWDLNKILQAGSGIEGAYNTLQSNKYRGQAIDLAKSQYNAGAPIRAAAQDKLLNSTAPDLSGTFQNTQNVFAPKYRSLQ